MIPLQGSSCNNSVIKIQLIRIKVRKYCFEKESYKFYIHKNFNTAVIKHINSQKNFKC